MATVQSNISQDLIWEVIRTNASTLVKRRSGGGSRFSRDPQNLMNVHSKKYSGHANEQAIGVNAGKEGGVILSTKRAGKGNTPASGNQTSNFGAKSSGRSTYQKVVNGTASRNYRPDLRSAAVSRASAIKKSQRPVKDSKPRKLRGNAAKKAGEDKFLPVN